jgi:hypothetical protein
LQLERLEARVVLAGAVAGVGTGLIANYFSDQELANLALTRTDAAVDFDWGQSSPDGSVPADNFSVRWTGKVQAQFSETYTFYTQSDEGVALWVNGQQVIDNFTDHTFAEDSGTITLKAGETYDIRLEYYDNEFDAAIKLLWASASTPKQIIPTTQLYADAGWTSGAWLDAGIGGPGGSGGSVSSVGSTFKVIGGGGTSGDGSDQFHYLYQTLNGDGVLVAQVSATQGTGGGAGGAGAGVMVRDSLGGKAAYASVIVDANGAGSFNYRAATNGVINSTGGAGEAGKYWVKLVRDGSFFRGYTSATATDGSWTYFGSANVPMGRTVYAGVFSTSGSAGGFNNAQFKNVAVTPVVPLGAGLDQVRDYSFGQIFVDVAKQTRTPSQPNLGPPVAMDANGWPTADFMTIFISGFANQAHLYNGTYKVSFNGSATLNTWFTPGGQIKNQVYDASTNTTTADFVVSATESLDGWSVALQFFSSKRDANAAVGSGITNLKVIRPGYDPNTTQTFQTAYLDHLKQFSVLRFMDWTQTNNNPVVEWSQRIAPTFARQSTTTGVAWEYVIQLANQLDKDIWINIPVNASDDYVQQLATLLKNQLEPDRVVYVEYSNEIWNGIFSQNKDNFNAASAEVSAGGSPLNADGETNTVYWGWRRVAKRIKEISDTFAAVWGASAINSRVRPVLAAQHANPEVIKQGLEFLERTYGSPNKYIYGIAAAPYFAMGSIDGTRTDLSVTEILNALQGSVNSLGNLYYRFDSYARRYGLASMTYEGGPDTDGSTNLANKKLANIDPRMKDIVASYLNTWYSEGGGLFNWFVAGPTNWTANGMWGLSNLLDNYAAPKALATIDVAKTPRQSLSFGIPIPGAFDARAIAGATTPYSSTYLTNPGDTKSFDYFIRAPRAGKYRIVLNAGTTASSAQLRLAINDSAVRTITLAPTASTTTFADTVAGVFDLAEGMNLIHATSLSSSTWNLQTVTVEPAPAADAAPTVATTASASPTSVNGKTTSLSVLGADNSPESNLVYSWEAINEQPQSVRFSVNGTNAAKNTTATFSRAGTYALRVTISDGLSTTTSTVNVTVNQVITSIMVTPSGTSISNGETRQFTATAKDQFGVNFYIAPTFTWGVDNAFGTISVTGVYQAPASGLGTATVRATFSAVTSTATVDVVSPRTPDNPVNVLPGLEYRYYEASLNTVPDFDTLLPTASGLLSNVSLSPKQRSDNFGIEYTGYVFVPGTGTYTFYTTSDDGSKLWVGGQLVVNNDGRHSSQERSGTIILDSGWHAFKLGYIEGVGNEELSVSFAGPGLASKQLIPNANLERANRAPTIATPPAAVMNLNTGKSADLSVVGSDESGEAALTYTWSATSIPAGAAAPVFSDNGSNAAKNSIATFSKSGSYTLQVAISDGMLTTTATVGVVVSPIFTSVTVSPSSASVKQNRTAQFTASATDQFGATLSNPQVTWSVSANGGTINSAGLYTAPAEIGSYTVTATGGSSSGSATVNVIDDPAPTVATPASATPNPVVNSTTALSVLGDDDGGEANLTYTWAATVIPQGASAPVFTVNGSNSAKSTTASFFSPGTYTFVVTISDGFKSVTSSVEVPVDVNAPTIVTPAAATPNPVAGTSTALSVTAEDDDGEAGLTYTWSTTGTPPAAVTYSNNSSNNAKNTTATFTKPGTYDFVVTVSDGATSVTSAVSVVVNQTVTTVTVTPTTASVEQSATRQFSAAAFDQFGAAMTTPPAFSWSVTSTGIAGNVSTTGLYTAPATGTPTETVIASAGGVSGSATVTVTAQSIFTADLDIGGPSIAGSYTATGGTYTVKASGADIFGTADQFHFVYKTMNGNGEIIARVVSVQNTHSRAKAGIMFRDSLDANAKTVLLVIAPDNTTSLQRRATTGGSMSTQNMSNSPAPYWLKLVRSGNTFVGYRSPDGVTWTTVGSTSVGIGTTAYVGLALTSHDNMKLNTSVFDNVSVMPALSGRAIGTAPASRTTSASTLSDGLTTTYYESSVANGSWTGMDLGSPRRITEILFAPRPRFEMRLRGGKFQASSTANFSSDLVDLYTIRTAPGSAAVIATPVTTAKAYRYVRYLSPNGSFGTIAEASFIGV